MQIQDNYTFDYFHSICKLKWTNKKRSINFSNVFFFFNFLILRLKNRMTTIWKFWILNLISTKKQKLSLNFGISNLYVYISKKNIFLQIVFNTFSNELNLKQEKAIQFIFPPGTCKYSHLESCKTNIFKHIFHIYSLRLFQVSSVPMLPVTTLPRVYIFDSGSLSWCCRPGSKIFSLHLI